MDNTIIALSQTIANLKAAYDELNGFAMKRISELNKENARLKGAANEDAEAAVED